MPRHYTKKPKDPSLPIKCKECGCKLSDYVIDPEKPECPVCHKAFRLPEIPPEPIKEGEPKPGIEVTVSTGGKEMTGTLTDYGIRARVNIPRISEIEFSKIGISTKSGKLLSKITIQCEDVSETSILRIIHMMNQRCQMGLVITAEKLQTDFLDVLDPVSNKRVLAQVSQKDIEDHGFGQVEAKTPAQIASNKLIEEAAERARQYHEKQANEDFKNLESANPDNPDNVKPGVEQKTEQEEVKVG